MVFLFHKKRHATPCDFLRCMLPRGRKIPIPVQEKKGKTPCDFLRCMLPRGRKIPIPVQEKKGKRGKHQNGRAALASLPPVPINTPPPPPRLPPHQQAARTIRVPCSLPSLVGLSNQEHLSFVLSTVSVLVTSVVPVLASGDWSDRSRNRHSMAMTKLVPAEADAVVAAARHFSFPPPRTTSDGESCRKMAAAQVDIGAAVVGSWLDTMMASSPRHRVVAPLLVGVDAEHDDWMVRLRVVHVGRARPFPGLETKKITLLIFASVRACRSGTLRHWPGSTRWRRRRRGSRSRCSWTTTARCPRSWKTPTAPS
jgi:hypothetical protein